MSGKFSQERAPLFEELQRYARQPLVPFHTPGHKAGRGLESGWHAIGFPAQWDVTEIPSFHWAGAWEEAEELAAMFFGADQTFFLTQGASQGIIGGILGLFSPGDTVLVGRNCHRSVIQAIVLAGIHPIFIETEFLPEFYIPTGIHIDSLQKKVREYQDCKGLILTNPTYQGISNRLHTYRKIIGNRILMVDEAHGGHLGWMGLEGFDAAGVADLWVHGTHKVLGSLTQTGMLHIKKGRIDPGRIKTQLDLITSTSPSYILLASLDSSRRYLALDGARMFAEKMPHILEFKESLAQVQRLRVLTKEQLADPDSKVVDPWKLSVHFLLKGLTGYQADTILREKYRIQSEYADISQVTFLAAPWQDPRELDELGRALQDITADDVPREMQPKPYIFGSFPDSIPPLIRSPRDAGLEAGERIPLQKAAGRTSAAVIAAYPPGIPLVAPGELIRTAEIEYIQEILAHQGWVNGVDHQGMIRVTRDK
jgi:arginine/lysine/ornithine decarboxylase